MQTKQALLLLNALFWVPLVAGILGACMEIRFRTKRSLVPDEPSWRNKLSIAGAVSASLAGLLFLGCVIRIISMNEWAGQDAGGVPTSFLYLRVGTYLSFAAVVLGLAGKGKGRWLIFSGGCFLLLLWSCMAIPE